MRRGGERNSQIEEDDEAVRDPTPRLSIRQERLQKLLSQISASIDCPCTWYEEPQNYRHFVIIGGPEDPDCVVMEIPQDTARRLKGGWRQDELRLIEACRAAAERYWSGATHFE